MADAQMFDDLKVAERKPPPSVLYHYTSAQGLQGILESGRLWASHIRYLNDSLEFEYLWQLLKIRIDERLSWLGSAVEDAERIRLLSIANYRPSLDAFVVSLSDDGGDRLSQWRGYCPQGFGFSIGLSGEAIGKFVAHLEGEIPEGSAVAQVFPIKYISEDFKKSFDEIIDRTWKAPVKGEGWVDEAFFSILTSIGAPRYKHNSFEEEREWRMALPCTGECSAKPVNIWPAI